MSAAVRTATTPGVAATYAARSPSVKLRPVMRRAHDADRERTVGGLVGAEDVGAAQLALAVDPAHALSHGLADRRGRLRGRLVHPGDHHRRDDLAVAGAAAEHAAERVHHLRLGGARRHSQQRRRRDEHPRRADAALRRAVRMERALQAPDLAARVETLEGVDAPAVEASHRCHAGADRVAVDEHRARAAVAGVAPHLRRREPEVVAQRRRSGAARIARASPRMPFTVERGDPLTGRLRSARAHDARAPRPPRRR